MSAWQERERDPLNRSKSKQMWSFNKSQRFSLIPLKDSSRR